MINRNHRKHIKNIVLVMMFMFIFSFMSQKSFAEYLEPSVLDYGTGSGEIILTFNDLRDNDKLFCAQRGQHIPSSNDMAHAYSDSFIKDSDETRADNDHEQTGASLSPTFTKEVTVKGSESPDAAAGISTGDGYSTESAAKYVIGDQVVCTPRAAYILNRANENTGNYYSAIQQAWWNIPEGSFGRDVEENSLSRTALAYHEFVKKIAKKPEDVENPAKYETLEHDLQKNGNTQKVSIQFPEVDENKLISSDTTKVDVNFDKVNQQYVIGPFCIHYIKGASETSGGESVDNVDFGGIEGFKVYTNASSNPVSEDKWRFEGIGDKEFPDSGESFYLVLDYIEGATKVTKMNVVYKYLVAGGTYQNLDGQYDINRYRVVRSRIKSITGEDEVTRITYRYNLVKLGTKGTQQSQKLSLVNHAARWYETKEIPVLTIGDREEEQEGSLKIYKKALDENGKEMTADEVKEKFGSYQYFDFRVKVTYADGKEENSTVTVRAGSSAEAGTYTWGIEEAAPTFKVEEVPPDNEDWEFVSIEPNNGEGQLKVNETVELTAINKLKDKKTPHKDFVKLYKQLSDPAKKDEEFKFSVVITMPDGTVMPEEIATIKVPKGEKTGNVWESKIYEWYGDEKPKFKIKEIETEDSKHYKPLITPDEDYLQGQNIGFPVNAYNTDNTTEKSFLTIQKELEEGQVTEDTFDFLVTVGGVANITEEALGVEDLTTKDGKYQFKVTNVKAGEKRGPYVFEWKDPNVAPTYTVEEINVDSNEAKVSTIQETIDGETGKIEKNSNQISGTFQKGKTTNLTEIKFTNNMTKHSGGIHVEKDIETSEKISKETLESEGKKFEFEVVIKGTFEYDGKKYENDELRITKKLPDEGKWEFDVKNVIWYGSKAPTFTVEEKNLPQGWKLKSIYYSDLENESTSTEGHKLIDDKTIDVKVINELPTYTEIDLTFTMAGIVWEDKTLDQKNNNENGYYSAPNGVYDKGEILKDNIEVNVYRVIYHNGEEIDRTIAKAFKDAEDNELVFPIITASDGKWEVPRINVPAFTDEEKSKGYDEKNGYSVDYDVEFIYDGQTYEPTEFLSYKIGTNGEKTKNEGNNAKRASEYRNAIATEKDKYARDSMALAMEEENAQKVISEVSGKTEINANGDTTGTVTLQNGTQAEITYSSENAGDGYPTISKVNTTNSDGRVLDVFKAKARTSVGNLTFPFDKDGFDGSSLTDSDVELTDEGVIHHYKFMAVYNYCLNINLGLVKRPEMDIGLTKKLDNAKVIVKEKMYQYNYSGVYDLTEEKVDSLAKTICEGDKTEVNHRLGLYKSDYYYRAEMYQNDDKLYEALTGFYSKTFNNKKDVTDTEMDIYLTYKITLANNSSAYDVQINSLDDYYDSSFTLVREPEEKYLKTKTVGGGQKQQDVNAVEPVADASDYADKWKDIKTGIVASDKDANGNNIIYNKMTADNLGILLKAGKTNEIKVTFKVNKENNNDAKNAIILGQKCNVAEIGSYTTYDKGKTEIVGKIDRDSAPSNLNIQSYNDKSWYEDDTFAAPRITVNLVDTDRTVNGLVWEDNSKDENTDQPGYNQQVGNGIMDGNEKTVGDLTTELVEKVIVPNADGTTYTQYNYIWPTDAQLDGLNNRTIEEISGFDSTISTKAEDGTYRFESVPAGDYVVKFTYGDKKIETKGYSTAKYYNGQDFKSTKYKAIIKGEEGAQYVNPSKYLDIDATNASTDIHNSVADSEVRRLEVVAKSREIMYDNNKILAASMSDEDLKKLGYTDEEITNNRNQLFENYNMFAETPKLNMNIEPSEYDGNGDNSGYTYAVKNVNFGLEERPATQLTLDKQIKQITLTTSDGTKIMDAKYKIAYEVQNDGSIKPVVNLDTDNSYGTDNLQALNRDQATDQGFRYINIETNQLGTTTIDVKYQFTVLNTGEVDRTGELANMKYMDDAAAFDEKCTDLSDRLSSYKKESGSLKNDTTLGSYVGSIYYYGQDGNQNDSVVTSTVRQLVDYIDNDVDFNEAINSEPNTSWSTIKAEQLKRLVKPEIVVEKDGEQTVLDEKEARYETADRNNLTVSVDSYGVADNTLNNNGFIVELVPTQALQGERAITGLDRVSMELAISRYIGSDSDDLQIDNIAEIIKYNNKVGRRDDVTIAGNQAPAIALKKNIPDALPETVSAGMVYERDTSATEVVTLSPPTGSGLMTWKLQVIGSVAAGLTIIAGGIILIKKKILK